MMAGNVRQLSLYGKRQRFAASSEQRALAFAPQPLNLIGQLAPAND
jgi:hypothetical protein